MKTKGKNIERSRPARAIRPVFATTETMAERAWRYGESAFVYHRVGGVSWFDDGSCLTRWGVDTARGARHTLDGVWARTGMDLNVSHPDAVDWSAA